MPTNATHIWRPSTARTVTLDSYVPVGRASAATAPVPLAWPAKDPADTLDYVLDFTAAVAGNAGDAIATLDVGIAPDAPGDLMLQSAEADGLEAVLWLTLGQPGTTYSVTVAVTTTGGRTIQRTVLLPVRALSTAITPNTALLTDTGAPLVDQNGNPVLLTD